MLIEYTNSTHKKYIALHEYFHQTKYPNNNRTRKYCVLEQYIEVNTQKTD